MMKPLVFVSSTIEGMRDIRSQVKQFLEQQLGYEVVMSEYEGSKPLTPLAQCRRWAKDCDFFIAILGQNYGWMTPTTGISVSEMEFQEAHKDNPEKILVYLSSQAKEPKQEGFARRILDFNQGYFRRAPFKTEADLVSGIRADMATLFKDSTNLIRSKSLKLKPVTTPSEKDYAILNLADRRDMMMTHAIALAEHAGFTPVRLLEHHFLLATRKVGRTEILFTINVVPGNYDRQELIRDNYARHDVQRDEAYESYPNRFALTIVHGSANLGTVEWLTHHFSGTAFRVEPGLFYGAGLLTIGKTRYGDLHFENRLILSGIRNEETMLAKMTEALEWIASECKRLNFRCNYRKPLH
jgi:hypothetical protein